MQNKAKGPKGVTKKAVMEALGNVFGWNFSYNFKESQTLITFGRDAQIIERLQANGFDIVEHRPHESPRTGNIKLAVKAPVEP